MGYPRERKEAVLKKMLPPNNKPIPEIANEEGISEGTLYNWRKAARAVPYSIRSTSIPLACSSSVRCCR